MINILQKCKVFRFCPTSKHFVTKVCFRLVIKTKAAAEESWESEDKMEPRAAMALLSAQVILRPDTTVIFMAGILLPQLLPYPPQAPASLVVPGSKYCLPGEFLEHMAWMNSEILSAFGWHVWLLFYHNCNYCRTHINPSSRRASTKEKAHASCLGGYESLILHKEMERNHTMSFFWHQSYVQFLQVFLVQIQNYLNC